MSDNLKVCYYSSGLNLNSRNSISSVIIKDIIFISFRVRQISYILCYHRHLLKTTEVTVLLCILEYKTACYAQYTLPIAVNWLVK